VSSLGDLIDDAALSPPMTTAVAGDERRWTG
jgi:hypothetical protein